MSHFEVVELVFGPQRHGKVIALGSGVTPTTFRSDHRVGSSSSSTSQHQTTDTQALREENMKLREDMTQMEVNMEANIERRMAEMQARMQADMEREMAR